MNSCRFSINVGIRVVTHIHAACASPCRNVRSLTGPPAQPLFL